MTDTKNTSTAPAGIDLDLDNLEALAHAAAQHGDDIGEDEWYSADKNMSLFVGNPDLALIAACSPVAILALIALARKAVSPSDLVTRESALRAIDHLDLSNSPGRGDDARALLVAASPSDATGKAVSIDVQVFAIDVEKRLYAALGRQWSPVGICIDSLIDDLKRKADATGKADAANAGGMRALADGYESGFFSNHADEDGNGQFTLHYKSAAQAEAAFMAITSMIEGVQSPATSAADAMDAQRYRALRDLMQSAKGSASIEVNQHLAYYEAPEPGHEVKLQWYPDTPIGFYTIEGSTLDEVADETIAASRKGGDHD
jgi:hypothetical protein